MIIDFHGHVGSMDSLGARSQPADMLSLMNHAGIDKACLFNICHGDAALGNELTARFVASHPDRFIGFAYVTPHYPEEIESVLAHAFDDLGMKGIKIYPPYFSRSVEDAAWEPIFAFAHARRAPIISHTDGRDAMVRDNHGEPQMFVPWARRYPDAPIVLGHAGNFRTGRQSCIQAVRSCPNVFIEICSSWRHVGSIEELVQGAGEDRILFGSDAPLMDPRIQMGRVVTAEISEQAKEKILGMNAAKLLNLDEGLLN
jgi:predicted TIM-barrel fold metal-dependent hydrolase